jgi:spore coat protein U-like protein
MKKHYLGILVSGAMLALAATGANALSVSNTFQTRITIIADCEINSPTDLEFGTHGLLKNNIDAAATFNVRCTQNVGYAISLDNGQNASGGTSRMTDGNGNFVTYELYQDSGRTTLWDTTNTVSGTGTGVDQSYTIYGRVPPQATPPAGNYADTVTITVTY